MQLRVQERLRHPIWLVLVAALCALPGARVIAQQAGPAAPAATPATPAGRAIPRPEDLEPGVNTTPSGVSPAAPAEAATATSVSSPSAPTSTPGTSATTPATTSAPTSTARTPAKSGSTAKTTGAKADRIELDTTDITGNRELPKVLYIVPWKRSDLGDLVGKPTNSLLNEVLAPVDRDVFKRENRYYDALKPDAGAASQAAAPAAAAPAAAAPGGGGKP